jgi:DNA-binding NarL/FixJ family response regulator
MSSAASKCGRSVQSWQDVRKPFVLPSVDAKAVTFRAEDIIVGANGQTSQTSVRIVVADDHGMVRDGVRMACEQRAGLELVGEAADGHEALRQILALRPDVALIDVVMPGGLDGFDVIRRLQQAGFEGKILILTSREDPEAVFQASVLGAHGFLRKTAGLDELADAIERVAAGARVFGKDDERLAIAQLGQMARQARPASRRASSLTARESQILRLLAEGLSTRLIAGRLGISEGTVETHISSVYRKLEVGTRVQAVRKASEFGLLDPSDRR